MKSIFSKDITPGACWAGAVLLTSALVATSLGFPSRNGGPRTAANPAARAKLAATAAGPEACPPVKAQQLYRFIAGIDTCMQPMSSQEIGAELNDPFGLMLSKNAGGAGLWPITIIDLQQAIHTAYQWAPTSFLVGEGSQIPASLPDINGSPVGRDGNRDLRYVLSWGANASSPVVFLSGPPAGVQGGTPPGFLQVVSFDPKKQAYNYYQLINNASVIEGGSSSEPRTWSWAGDSTYARKPATLGQGCFACHLNGGLNMKELTPPWNNWSSPDATVSSLNVPEAMAKDPLFSTSTLNGADQFQNIFQGAMFNYTRLRMQAAIKSGTVSTSSELLRRLIATPTINFRSSPVLSAGTGDITGVPKDFFLNDAVLNGVLGLKYQVPELTIHREHYDQFVTSNHLALVNSTDRPPSYRQPGATFFAFFVPAPAYEDIQAIKLLINNKVISPQFAAAILMVDFPNPVFSPARAGLMKYASQIATGKADGADIPNQFAALVKAAAESQPAVDAEHLAGASPEQQFLFFWNQTDWQTACATQINAYLAAVGGRIGTAEGASDYLTLSISRGTQFGKDPLVGNLNEFELLLPKSDLGQKMAQMLPNGTIAPLASLQ